MKVLLIKPHSWFSAKGFGFPLGIAYLASSLIKKKHNVKILDLMLYKLEEGEEIVLRTLNEFNPDLIGITCNSHERFFVFDLAKIVKRHKDIPVVVGGPHVTLTAEETLEWINEIDIIVLNEGERTIVELCEVIENNKDIKEVNGIVYRRNQEIVRTKRRPFIENLDVLPFPAWGLFEIQKYDLYLPIPGKPSAIQMISSRGCPFRCNFCSATIIAGNKIRYRSPKNVVDELETLHNLYPEYEWIFIYDDNFIANKQRVINICEEILKRKIKINWGCYGRVDSIEENIVKIMAESGCKMISFGVESGSNKVLKIMDKRINSTMIMKAIKNVKTVGMISRCSFISGYPGENFLDFIKTIYLIWKMQLKKTEIVWNFCPMIYPATGLFEKLKAAGYLQNGFSWSKVTAMPLYKDIPLYIPKLSRFNNLLYRLYRKFVAKGEEFIPNKVEEN